MTVKEVYDKSNIVRVSEKMPDGQWSTRFYLDSGEHLGTVISLHKDKNICEEEVTLKADIQFLAQFITDYQGIPGIFAVDIEEVWKAIEPYLERIN